MRSANPALSTAVFREAGRAMRADDVMTLQGTVVKTMILLAIIVAGAGYVWNQFFTTTSDLSFINVWMIGGAIGGLILGMITIFKKTWAPVTAPLYAACEGFFLGGVSSFFEMRYPGVVIQAVGLTFGTLFALLLVYQSGLIKVTDNFRLGVAAATGGIFLVYLVQFVLSFFGMSIPFIHESGLIGIGFSLFVVVIASMNLVMDFDFIENGVNGRAPRYMEWYASFGLIVTLVWLYLEFLRLLAKINDRR